MNDDLLNEATGLLDDATELPPRPPFLKRLWMVFGVPGELFAALAQNPAWFPMALFVAVVAGAGMALVPADAFVEAAQQNQSPEQAAQTADAMALVPPIVVKAGAVVFTTLVMLILPLVISLVTYVIFVFIRGDEARLKQHLAVVAHAGVIALIGSLLSTLVTIVGGAPLGQELSLGTLLPFLPEGYLADVLNALGIFGIWTASVVGIGLAAIDPRRSAGSTAGILIALLFVAALVRGAF